MADPSSFKFSLACGVAGAWTEVTADVVWSEGNIPYQWGRTSGFDQSTRPGLYSFTLANPTGDYSPDNPLSTLATPLVEGMGANWELNGVQRAGTIRSVQPLFADGGKVPDAGRVRVTVDDQIGNAARHDIGDVTAQTRAASPYLWWKMDDATGSVAASDTTVTGKPVLTVAPATAAGILNFGVAGPLGFSQTQLAVTSASGVAQIFNLNLSLPTLAYAGTDLGWWNLVMTQSEAMTCFLSVTYGNFPFTSGGNSIAMSAIWLGSGASTQSRFSGASSVNGSSSLGTRVYSCNMTTTTVAGTTTLFMTPYLDGVAVSGPVVVGSYAGVAPTAAQASPTLVVLQATAADTTLRTAGFSNLSLTRYPLSQQMYVGNPVVASQRIAEIAQTTPEITLDTVPTMSPAILGTQGGSTTLAALDEVLRGEQGGMKVITTGTLTAPVPKLTVYARDRKRAVDMTISFNQIQDKPQFVRALTNTVAYATASGPTEDVTYFDPTMPALVGSANTSDQVTLRDHNDLYASASDRLYRGKNTLTPILSFQIDARSLDVNLWTQLMAMRPGHRVHITDCAQLNFGYQTWDGWIVGGDELHTGETRSLFTIYVQPAWDVPVYGTARYAAGAGVMTLQSNITSSATSIGIVSTGDLFTTNGAHFPQNITIGNEIVTLSGVTGASSPQTGTVTARGVGIVPAKAWTAGAAIDVSPLWRYDY